MPDVLTGRGRPSRYWKIDLESLTFAPSDGGEVRIAAPGARGLIACTLEDARRDHAQLLARAAGKTGASETKFGAATFASDHLGAFVFVPADRAIDEPIVITYTAGKACYPHTVVFVEHGARASIVERYEGTADSTICGVVEIVTEENANITFVTVQNLPDGARVITTREALPGDGARIAWAVADLGAQLTVGSADSRIEHPGAHIDTAALFFPRANQHVDLMTNVDHTVGPATSDTLVKAAAIGRGQGRYIGMIRIVKDAQGSVANLRDDALLLSKTAHIDSVPALEIAANDVKAYHGATVGAIDQEQIFYMESRGIERSAAERMIALGFFEPVIERFPGESLREELREILRAKIL